MIKYLLVFLLIIITAYAHAQDFPMINGSIGVCSGNWQDPGGIYNYGNNENLTQTLYSSTGQCLRLSFNMFNVDATGDTIFIYDGINTSFPLIGKYTGQIFIPPVNSSAGAFTFHFKSNATIVKPGWLAQISCVSCPASDTLPANMTSGIFETCNATFYDAGGTGNYSTNQSYITTIFPSDSGSYPALNFSSFNLGTGDDLKIYNGISTAYPLIGTYTGSTSPGIINATLGAVTLVFTSDTADTTEGWVAAVGCHSIASDCETCSGTIPINNNCENAIDLSSLPLPAACPYGVGGLKIVNGTNLCATGSIPYLNQTGCNPSGNLAVPSADVWYKFSINAPTLNVKMIGLDTPQVGLYFGNDCNSLIPEGCAIGKNGMLTTTFGGLTTGTYYLQIGGGSLTDQCDFTLILQNNYDCAGCVITSNITATPLPVNGTYLPGETVNFCYTITDFNQVGASFLHGVVPTFDIGWDTTSFVPSATLVSCSSEGTWNWYNNNIYSATNAITAGPGWFFETNLGNPSNVFDSIPSNNFGDNNQLNNCDWQFCWSITTIIPDSCFPAKSLNITLNTYGDGETGSWVSQSCSSDPYIYFHAIISCCDTPGIAQIGDTLFASEASLYQWYLDGNMIPGADKSFYIPSQNGNYTVQTLCPNGCGNISSAFNVINVGIENILAEEGISIYPNPSLDNIVYITNRNLKSTVHLSVLNMNGKEVYDADINTLKTTLDLNFLSKGVYFVRLTDSDDVYIQKITLQ